MRRFNSKLFLWLLGISIVLGAGAYLVHRLQTGRIAQALLWQARRAEEQGQPDQAIRYLGRYLEFVPNDTRERANLGRLLAEQVLGSERGKLSYRTATQALFVLEGVVAGDPQRQDMRRQLARVALLLGRADVALDHLNQLHDALPNDGEVCDLLGQCHAAQEHYADAAILWWQSIQLAPQQREVYERLASLLSRPDRAQWKAILQDPDQVLRKDPAQVLDLLVTKNEGDYHAHLVRWNRRYVAALRDPKHLTEAARDVDAALRLAPNEPEVLLAAAELARAEGNLPKAREYLTHGLEMHREDKHLYLALAEVELADSKPQVAIARLTEGLKVLPEQTDLLWLQANLLIDGGKRDLAEKTLAQMRKAKATETSLDYLQARLLLLQGRAAEASRRLEFVRPQLERDGAAPALLDQIDLYLAGCYKEMDEPAQQLAAYERLIGREGQRPLPSPALLPALEGRGRILWGLGRPDEAIAQYQDLLKRGNAPKAAWVELARLLIGRNLVRGLSDWREVEATLQRAARELPEAVEVSLLQARVLSVRQDWDRARATLQEARRRFPKRVEPWAALIELAEFQKQPEQVAQLIKEMDKQTGDSVELRLARARSWAEVAKQERGAFPLTLAAKLDSFTRDEQSSLLRGLVEIAYRTGKKLEASQLWGQLAALPQHEHDARIKLVQIELALETEDAATLNNVLDQVRSIEGGHGPLWSYGAALRLLRQGQKNTERAALDQAAALLDTVALQRPGWAAVELARADVDKLRNNPDEAIRHYQKALELNERSPRVLRELARLLDQRGRTNEADAVMRQMTSMTGADSDLQWLAADVALRNHDPGRAVQLAMAAVAENSTDCRDYLRRGVVLAADGRLREAERDLRRGVELGGDRPEAWLALVRFLAGIGQRDEAREVMETARGKLPAGPLALTLAQCCEALGDVDGARQHYEEALKLQPAEFLVREAAVTFYVRAGLPREAEAMLRPLVQEAGKAPDSEVDWARRRLALLLASYSDEQHFLEALSFAGLQLKESKTAASKPESKIDDVRVQAHVLASRERRACRTQAITLLEDLTRRRALTPDDQFLLVRLYEAEGYTTKARKLLVALVASQGDNPTYLTYHIRSLIRQREFTEAQRYVEQLMELEKKHQAEPNTLGSLDLQALVLEGRDQAPRALELVRAHANRKNARPEDVLLLAGCLTRQKRFDEAVAACEIAWGTCRPQVVGAANLAVLRAMRPGAEPYRRLEKHLEAARAKDPKAIALILYLAELHDLQGNYARAETYYRQALALDPGNLVAMNNLAWLMAETAGDTDEALTLIQRAIQKQGARAELLDTRAVVQMARNQVEAAIRDLEQANADQPSPSRYFRLAQAHYLAKDREAALTALRRAKSSGLKPEQLHPIEQTAFRKVMTDLDPQ